MSEKSKRAEFIYNGEPWTAARIKSSCYVLCRSVNRPEDSMTWSVPDDSMLELDWHIRRDPRHNPSREEVFRMLSVIDSYRSILGRPAKEQRALARVLKEFI